MILTHQMSGNVRSCPVLSVASLCVAASPLFVSASCCMACRVLFLNRSGFLTTLPHSHGGILNKNRGAWMGCLSVDRHSLNAAAFYPGRSEAVSSFISCFPGFIFPNRNRKTKPGACVSIPQNKKQVTFFLDRTLEIDTGSLFIIHGSKWQK